MTLLPKPVTILIPSAVVLYADLREHVLVKEKPVTLEIAEIYRLLVRCKSLALCLGEWHGFSRLAGHGFIIKVNGMVTLIL